MKNQELVIEIIKCIKKNLPNHLGGFMDIGFGIAEGMGISQTKLCAAVAALVDEGYKVFYISIEEKTEYGLSRAIKLLGGPDSTYADALKNSVKRIRPVNYQETSEEIMVRILELDEKVKDEFNAVEAYPAYEGMTMITQNMQRVKLGQVLNLITDMTTQGATKNEIQRALKYSIVVLDSVKHNLNHRQAFDDFGIRSLIDKYEPFNLSLERR